MGRVRWQYVENDSMPSVSRRTSSTGTAGLVEVADGRRGGRCRRLRRKLHETGELSPLCFAFDQLGSDDPDDTFSLDVNIASAPR